MNAKQNYSNSSRFHITAIEGYYEITTSLNIHTMNQKDMKANIKKMQCYNLYIMFTSKG